MQNLTKNYIILKLTIARFHQKLEEREGRQHDQHIVKIICQKKGRREGGLPLDIVNKYTIFLRLPLIKHFKLKSKSIHSVGFGFSSISPSNLGQISKSGTVLKSTSSQLFKTVPDFEI